MNNIPDNHLDIPLIVSSYEISSLRDLLNELDLDEQFVDVEYKIRNTEKGHYLDKFYAWTETYVIIDIINEDSILCLIKIPRHPKYV